MSGYNECKSCEKVVIILSVKATLNVISGHKGATSCKFFVGVEWISAM